MDVEGQEAGPGLGARAVVLAAVASAPHKKWEGGSSFSPGFANGALLGGKPCPSSASGSTPLNPGPGLLRDGEREAASATRSRQVTASRSEVKYMASSIKHGIPSLATRLARRTHGGPPTDAVRRLLACLLRFFGLSLETEIDSSLSDQRSLAFVWRRASTLVSIASGVDARGRDEDERIDLSPLPKPRRTQMDITSVLRVRRLAKVVCRIWVDGDTASAGQHPWPCEE